MSDRDSSAQMAHRSPLEDGASATARIVVADDRVAFRQLQEALADDPDVSVVLASDLANADDVLEAHGRKSKAGISEYLLGEDNLAEMLKATAKLDAPDLSLKFHQTLPAHPRSMRKSKK
jgi:DNA-binding NtrC family response regulator